MNLSDGSLNRKIASSSFKIFQKLILNYLFVYRLRLASTTSRRKRPFTTSTDQKQRIRRRGNFQKLRKSSRSKRSKQKSSQVRNTTLTVYSNALKTKELSCLTRKFGEQTYCRKWHLDKMPKCSLVHFVEKKI